MIITTYDVYTEEDLKESIRAIKNNPVDISVKCANIDINKKRQIELIEQLLRKVEGGK